MNAIRTLSRVILPLLLVVGSHAFAMESGTFLQDDVLLKKPEPKSKVLATVTKGTKVEILRIYGPWYLVRNDRKQSGWAIAAHLRRHDSTVGPGVGASDAFGGVSSMQSAPSSSAAPSTGAPSSVFRH